MIELVSHINWPRNLGRKVVFIVGVEVNLFGSGLSFLVYWFKDRRCAKVLY